MVLPPFNPIEAKIRGLKYCGNVILENSKKEKGITHINSITSSHLHENEKHNSEEDPVSIGRTENFSELGHNARAASEHALLLDLPDNRRSLFLYIRRIRWEVTKLRKRADCGFSAFHTG